MNNFIHQLVSDNYQHGLWLNTLSLMENTGAKKIKNFESKFLVTETILKHSAEESRHAYFLKKQLSKLSDVSLPTYERQYLLAPADSLNYLNLLDVQVCRYLKSNFNYNNEQLKYAAYLLVTFAIEVRADEIYPIYQQALDSIKSNINVKSIIAEEMNHLAEMKSSIASFFEDPNTVCDVVIELEKKLYDQWILGVEKHLTELSRTEAKSTY